jgi:hypothetical protein
VTWADAISDVLEAGVPYDQCLLDCARLSPRDLARLSHSLKNKPVAVLYLTSSKIGGYSGVDAIRIADAEIDVGGRCSAPEGTG